MIIKSQQRLVANIALLYCRKGAPLEDIIQEGNVGLVKAAERFDYTQYRSFSNYAKSWILQSISASMTTMPYTVRLPLNQLLLYRKVRKFKEKFEQKHGYIPSVNDIEIDEELDTERIRFLDGLPYNLSSLTSLFSDLDNKESETNAIDDFINKNESRITIKNLLKRLGNRERQIIQRFYGINAKEETLSSIGDYYGLTRERARQIKENTVKHLRDLLKSGKNNNYDSNSSNKDIAKPKNKITQKGKGHKSLRTIKDIEVGDRVILESKPCTVLEKRIKYNIVHLQVKYDDGRIDIITGGLGKFKVL
jgi:RNA polymerase primary sigma factor